MWHLLKKFRYFLRHINLTIMIYLARVGSLMKEVMHLEERTKQWSYRLYRVVLSSEPNNSHAYHNLGIISLCLFKNR